MKERCFFLILLDLVTSLFNKEQFLIELPVLIPKLLKRTLYSQLFAELYRNYEKMVVCRK